MVAGLANGGELHDENGDRGQQEQMNHAALMKNNDQDKPGQAYSESEPIQRETLRS